MTPGARLAAAIEILDGFIAALAAPGEAVGADRLLSDWARGARYAGSKDRAAVADHVFAALRRLQSAQADAPRPGGRAAALGALRLEGASLADLSALADGGAYRPAPLEAAEQAWLEGLPAAAARQPGLDFPDWLRGDLVDGVGDAEGEIAALRRRAAFDLRANALKAAPDEAAAALAADGLETSAAPLAPGALRAVAASAGRPKLSRLRAYQMGMVEPQDAASQAAALLAVAAYGLARADAAPDRDGLVLDLCAGGGGKTLALAAALPRGARLGAFDVAPRRMADLPARLARAGADAAILDRDGLRALGGADLVLIDAPCSGCGAWARQPDAKWRLTAARLDALRRAQADALRLGAAAVRPGGALAYVTCSLLASENLGAVTRFLAADAAFEPIPAAPLWRAAGLIGAPQARLTGPLREAAVLFTPARDGTDGFFFCAMRHAMPPR